MYMNACVHHVCAVPVETRRGRQVSWDWSYRWLRVWVLGIEPRSSAKTSALAPILGTFQIGSHSSPDFPGT